MKHLLLFPLFLIPIFAFAQKTMDMEACMRYAVENSYKTARAVTDLNNAKKDYTGAILSHLPSVDGSIGFNSSFGRGIDPATNTYINTTSFSNSVGMGAGMPIFNGLRYLNNTRSTKIAKLRGEEQLRQTRDKVAEETMLAYAEVVYNTELLKLYQKRIENYQIEEKRMTRLLELGGGAYADLTQIRATLAAEEYTAIAARNNLEISIVKLKDCMNFPLDEILLIEPQIKETELYFEEQTSTEIVAYALNNHPTAIIEQYNLNWQKRSLSMERGRYYPSLWLNGGFSTGYFTSTTNKYDPYLTQYKNNLGEYLGVSINIPVFSGLDTRLRVAKAKNNLKQAQRDYDETLRTLSSEIRQAMMELEASKSQWQQAQKNVEYQQIANQANKRRYEDGTLSIIELQTSDNQLFLSEIELKNAYLRYQIKVREMNYYKGVPYVSD
jgi:outer membrane protein